MSHIDVIYNQFPNAIPEEGFIWSSFQRLKSLGYTRENTIACICCCRDEISQTLPQIVKIHWGEAFNLAGLGGLFSAGRTGISACLHHSPHEEGKERYVFYITPHIGIDRDGKWGVVKRKGQVMQSNSCGALSTFLKEIEEGRIKTGIDERDLEMCYLRMRLLRKLSYGRKPDLLELTMATHEVVMEDIEEDLKNLIDPRKADYSLFTGIQINAPDTNYVGPLVGYAMIDGKRVEISF